MKKILRKWSEMTMLISAILIVASTLTVATDFDWIRDLNIQGVW